MHFVVLVCPATVVHGVFTLLPPCTKIKLSGLSVQVDIQDTVGRYGNVNSNTFVCM